ncbi:MAG: sigma-54 dependent transcriptional regulator [Paludisphaera borealis]|uniref:sigma-54-dependent transcriptional regulator n=1 Tax=Paludisphaera borealis TaxID=1387353 RepID=UPI00283DC1BE|nr:sigma-54 dependent transcriptional regulator [Paludisphaera borealis]MDR3622662.1 sigma-54 dependent transcriptional regulator [Paludisphaera borealis]
MVPAVENEPNDLSPRDDAANLAHALEAARRILLVEDDEDTRNSFQQLLGMALGVDVDLAVDGSQALAMLLKQPYSIVITDLRMPKLDGMKLIEEIQTRRLPVTVIVTTGHGSIHDAVQAMRLGAYDFLTKPPDPQHLCLLVERALRERTLQDELTALRSQIGERHRFWNILSKCPRMYDIFELIGHVADTTTTVLIEGETGTGKEQVARAIHQASSVHRNGPFVPVHCAALPESLLESELFGHEKGSFTGAAGQRKGRFEIASGGTLFLDEVADIPLPMQVKLLRVLQERKFERIGGNQTIEVDVRVIAATNRGLDALVKEGKFREDLYYRLNVVKIDLPPLRQRPEDVPLLATYFAQKYSRPGQNAYHISNEAMERLLTYAWPGNIRQLENAMERACVTARNGEIRPENLPRDLLPRQGRKGSLNVDLARPLTDQLSELTAAFEERYLRKALRKCRGHVGRCAKISGLSRRSISAKIAHYKIDTAAYKPK